jgi:hypothetical protein
MKPLTTGQGIFYAALAVIGAYVAFVLLSALSIIAIGLYWRHP